jgi:L-alanine-DL-glutamate epimerase-like enolase superfamily enzyme
MASACHRAIEVVQPDVCWCGGLTAIRRVAVATAEHGLVFMPHRGGSVYGLPLVLAHGNAPLAESCGTGAPGTDLMHAMTSRFEGGADWPSEAPGFGGEVTEELVRAHARR